MPTNSSTVDQKHLLKLDLKPLIAYYGFFSVGFNHVLHKKYLERMDSQQLWGIVDREYIERNSSSKKYFDRLTQKKKIKFVQKHGIKLRQIPKETFNNLSSEDQSKILKACQYLQEIGARIQEKTDQNVQYAIVDMKPIWPTMPSSTIVYRPGMYLQLVKPQNVESALKIMGVTEDYLKPLQVAAAGGLESLYKSSKYLIDLPIVGVTKDKKPIVTKFSYSRIGTGI